MTRCRSRLMPRCSAAAFAAACLSAAVLGSAGCSSTVEGPKPVKSRYGDLGKDPTIGPTSLMVNTVKERTVLQNVEPLNVSGYGLVGRLRGTGDCLASAPVRAFIVKEMYRHGVGSRNDPVFKDVSAADILRDPNYAIVRVDAWIPAGARKDDFIDAQVTCIDGNDTSSLLHGNVFETDLKRGGADVDVPRGAVNTEVRVKGPLVVNPAYAMENPLTGTPQARASLRTAHVMFNARVMADRPLHLLLRQPEFRMAPIIAERISSRFQNEGVGIAKAKDEGLIEIVVPASFNGDWERFGKLVQHLYLRADAQFNADMARRLAAKAVEPGAPLEDISYCLEGIGAHAAPFLAPLLNHPDQQVAFWAARAAAFIGDNSSAAETRLAQMAREPNHPFQLAALRALGSLPHSTSLSYLIKPFVRSEQALVRVEAYRILARNRGIESVAVAPSGEPSNQKFMLDIVRTDDPPLVYATRTGKPRIGIIGRMPQLKLDEPVTILDNRLTIAAAPRGKMATLFFRDPHQPAPVRIDCPTSLDVLIARLAGRSTTDGAAMDFTYGEIVAIVQTLVDNNRLEAAGPMSSSSPVAFMMQDPPRVYDDLAGGGLADAIAGGDAPQFGPAGPVASAAPAATASPAATPGPLVAAPRPAAPRPTAARPPLAGPAVPAAGQAPDFAAAPDPAPKVPTAAEGSNAPKF